MESYQKQHLQKLLQFVTDTLTQVSKKDLPQEIKGSTAKTAELAKKAKEVLDQ